MSRNVEENTLKRRLFRVLNSLPLLLGFTAMVATLLSFAGLYSSVFGRTEELPPPVLQSDIARLEREISTLQRRNTTLENSLATLSQVPEESQTVAQLTQIQGELSDAQSRVAKIEEVILDDPAKALEMPLLRRDIDNLRAQNETTNQTLRADVDRVYDQNKWFLGLMATMALGLVTLALNNFFKREKEQEATKE